MKRLFAPLMLTVVTLVAGEVVAVRSGVAAAQPASISTITVTISPASAEVCFGKTQTFYAAVANDPNNLGVSWTFHTPCDFGPACHGLLTPISPFKAVYQAPDTTAGNPITIIATSNADPAVYATAGVTIVSCTTKRHR